MLWDKSVHVWVEILHLVCFAMDDFCLRNKTYVQLLHIY